MSSKLRVCKSLWCLFMVIDVPGIHYDYSKPLVGYLIDVQTS